METLELKLHLNLSDPREVAARRLVVGGYDKSHGFATASAGIGAQFDSCDVGQAQHNRARVANSTQRQNETITNQTAIKPFENDGHRREKDAHHPPHNRNNHNSSGLRRHSGQQARSGSRVRASGGRLSFDERQPSNNQQEQIAPSYLELLRQNEDLGELVGSQHHGDGVSEANATCGSR